MCMKSSSIHVQWALSFINWLFSKTFANNMQQFEFMSWRFECVDKFHACNAFISSLHSSYVSFIALLNDCTSRLNFMTKNYKAMCISSSRSVILSIHTLTHKSQVNVIEKNRRETPTSSIILWHHHSDMICILNWAKIFNSIELSHAPKISLIIIHCQERGQNCNWSAYFSLPLLLLSISIVF